MKIATNVCNIILNDVCADKVMVSIYSSNFSFTSANVGKLISDPELIILM